MIMTQNSNVTTQPIPPGSLGKRMLVGAGIGLLLISLFLSGVKNPNPEWGKFWMIRPLIIVPLAGAMGGLCNYYLVHFHDRFGVNKPVAIIASVLVFIIGLWLGFVLGLEGTLWN
jgi:hypothetical protein